MHWRVPRNCCHENGGSFASEVQEDTVAGHARKAQLIVEFIPALQPSSGLTGYLSFKSAEGVTNTLIQHMGGINMIC